VHFGDRPPAEQEVEELAIPQGPSEEEIKEAKAALRLTLELRHEREDASADEASQRGK
jgi:hypothetical protein